MSKQTFYIARDCKAQTDEDKYDNEFWVFVREPERRTAFFGKQITYESKWGRAFLMGEDLNEAMGIDLKPGECGKFKVVRHD